MAGTLRHRGTAAATAALVVASAWIEQGGVLVAGWGRRIPGGMGMLLAAALSGSLSAVAVARPGPAAVVAGPSRASSATASPAAVVLTVTARLDLGSASAADLRGTATPGALVAATWPGHAAATTRAGADGAFSIRIDGVAAGDTVVEVVAALSGRERAVRQVHVHRAAPPPTPPPPPPPPAPAGVPADLASRTLGCTVSPGSPALRRADARAPLRVWGGGDSVFGFAGLDLSARAADTGVVVAHGEYTTSSGLTRPDFYDWPARIRQAVAQYDPEVVVFMAGGNDLQAVPGGHLWGTPGWTDDYAALVRSIVRSLTGQGRQVYWLGMPRMRDAQFDAAMQTLDAAVRMGVAGQPGAAYCDTAGYLAGPDGGFLQRWRAPDGIHLQPFTGNALAAALLRDVVLRMSAGH